jgi:uncharacterized protein (TIGR02271 family)
VAEVTRSGSTATFKQSTKDNLMAYEATPNAAGVGTTTQVVVGLFNDAADAHQAVTQLRAAGFSSNQIGAAFRGESIDRYRTDNTTKTGAIKHDAENWWEKVKDAFRPDDKVEARREVAADSTLDTDPYARDEYEYDYAGDEFQGSLTGAGIPSDRAAYLSRNLRAGGAIVTVRDTDRAAEAEQILSSNNGKVRYEDVAGTDFEDTNLRDAGVTDANYRAAEVAGFDATAAATGREVAETEYADRRPTDAKNSAVDRVQLFGEVLRVHKERINRGEVRVRKDVVTENQTIEVPVTREELVLERVGVAPNTPATSANIGQGQEIRVPLSEDKVRVEKQPVVREEVVVGKREVADVARVGGDVRHEELRIDSDVETPKRTAAGEELSEDVRRRG